MCCIIAFRDCSELLLFFPCAVCRSLYRLQRQITSGCWHEFRGSCSFNCKSTQVSTLSYRHNTTTMWGSMVSQKPCLRFYDWDLLNMRVQFLLPLTQGLLVYCCGPYLTLSTWLLMKVIYILVICIALGIFFPVFLRLPKPPLFQFYLKSRLEELFGGSPTIYLYLNLF